MKNLYYYSDAGCIKIGNENFNLLLLNEKGEGSFWIHILKKEESKKNIDGNFVSRISGRNIYIYESNRNNNRIEKLEHGEYLIYVNKGDFFFKEV